MSRAPTVSTLLRRAVPALLLLAVAAPPEAAATPDSYRSWNHPYRKYLRCVRLKSTTVDPPTRWLDFRTTGYHVPNPSFFDSGSDLMCPSGGNWIRIDATER